MPPRVLFAAAAIAVLLACGGGQASRLLPSSQSMTPATASDAFDLDRVGHELYVDTDTATDPGAGASASAKITIKIPPHGRLKGQPHAIDENVANENDASDDADLSPDYTSPGTQGLGVVIQQGKKKVSAFFKITSKTKACKKNKKTKALTCTFVIPTIPVGKDTFAITGYAFTSKKSAVLESVKVKKTVKAGSTTTLKFTLNGDVRTIMQWIANPYPPVGTNLTVPIKILAADAWGYIIIGKFYKPIVIADTDKSGATKLSATTLASSTTAAALTLAYNGATMPPAIINASSASTRFKAQTIFAPGSSGIIATPAGLLVQLGSPGSLLTLTGPGVVTPFSVATTPDTLNDPSCTGLVGVSTVSSNVFLVKALVGFGACSLSISDSGGHKTGVPVLLQPEPSPSGNPSPSPTPVSNSNSVIISPDNAVVCQTNNLGCATTTMTLAVSQNAYSGTFSATTTCPASIASLSPASGAGPNATFKVSGGANVGSCNATFFGGGGKSTTIAITTTGANSNDVVASPSTLTICPSSGADACTLDTATVAIAQTGYVGTFAESNTCTSGVATIVPVSEAAPNGSYTITGGSGTGSCQMTVYGAGSKATTVDIDVVAPGSAPVIASPTAATLCPSGCSPNTSTITISQALFTGAFDLATTCAPSTASIAPQTPGQTSGPSSKYVVTGGSTQGRCTATWTGAAGLKVVVTVDVTSSGWTINTRTSSPTSHRSP